MENLQEVFGAVAIGSMSLVIAIYLLTVVVPCVVWTGVVCAMLRYINALNKESLSVGLLLLFIFPSIYGFGLITQDVTDHLTDKDYEAKSPDQNDFFAYLEYGVYINKIRDWLGSEDYYRANALVKGRIDQEKLKNGGCQLTRYNSLGKQVNRTGGIGLFLGGDKAIPSTSLSCESLIDVPEHFNANEHFCLYQEQRLASNKKKGKSEKCPAGLKQYEFRDFSGKATAYYYRAKNWAYREHANHYTELESIQRRIDFSRSVFLVSWLSLAAIALFFLIALLIDAATLLFYKYNKNEFGTVTNRSVKLNVCRKYGSVCIVVILLLGITRITKVGYAHAENNYNERVIGYFASHCEFQNPAKDQHKTKCWYYKAFKPTQTLTKGRGGSQG